MPIYSYTATGSEKKEVVGRTEAADICSAIDDIRSNGYLPSDIEKKSDDGAIRHSAFPVTLTSLFRKKNKTPEVARFTRELADLLASGFSLRIALSILHDRHESGSLGPVLAALAADVHKGMPLFEALAQYPGYFDNVYREIIREGETKGMLEATARELAVMLEKRSALDRQIKQSVFRSFGSLLVALVLLSYVYSIAFPVVEKGFNLFFPFRSFYGYGRYRSLFRILVAIEENFPDLMLSVLICFLVPVAIVLLLLRLNRIRKVKHRITASLPYLNRIARTIAMAQLLRPLSILLRSGVPFARSLDIAKDAIGNRTMAKRIGKVAASSKGKENSIEVLEQSNIFPAMVISAILRGELADNLEIELSKLAEAYESDAAFVANQASARFTKAAIVVLLVCFCLSLFSVGFIANIQRLPLI